MIALAIAITASAWGQVKPAEPTTLRQLLATIIEVKGLVQVRPQQQEPWRLAKRGMTLTEGAEFRTGPRSFVRFMIQPNQMVLLDRMGVIKIVQAVLDASRGKAKTDLGMKYGRTRYDVQRVKEIEYESTIHSPNATCAVRGTDIQLADNDGFATSITSHHGRIEATVKGFRAISMGTASINSQRRTPALKAQGDTTLDPKTAFSARTTPEMALVERFPSLGGIDSAAVLRLLQLSCQSLIPTRLHGRARRCIATERAMKKHARRGVTIIAGTD